MWSGSLDLFFSIYYMAIQTCGPRVPAHDNRGMSIEWPGSHACTHRERGPQSVRIDFTKLIWDFNYALYKAVYVLTKLVDFAISWIIRWQRTNSFMFLLNKYLFLSLLLGNDKSFISASVYSTLVGSPWHPQGHAFEPISKSILH